MAAAGSMAAPVRTITPLRGTEGAIYNAENITVTDGGRIFVTGSKGVYEVIPEYQDRLGEWVYRMQEVFIEVPLPSDCFTNGIVAIENNLYLACSRIYSPVLSQRDWGLTDLAQSNPLVSTSLYACMAAGDAKSWIIRANIAANPKGRKPYLHFDTIVAEIPGKSFANGLAADPDGTALYVASSMPWPDSCIYQVKLTSSPTALPTCWHHPAAPCLVGPNGVKVDKNYVYYTCVPSMASTASFVAVPKVVGVAPWPGLFERICSALDDFDVTPSGFVVANMSSGSDSGALLFLGPDGELNEIVQDSTLKNPSAVAVLKQDISRDHMQVLNAGDILVTDKTRGCVLLVQSAKASIHPS